VVLGVLDTLLNARLAFEHVKTPPVAPAFGGAISWFTVIDAVEEQPFDAVAFTV
jgi:hypothetical protein